MSSPIFFDTRVAIIVGHWQKDSGAVDVLEEAEDTCPGTKEVDLTLAMSQRFQQELNPLVAQTKLIGGSLGSRVRQVRDMMAHVAISIHANSSTNVTAHGHEVLVNPARHADNARLAEIADSCLDHYLVNGDRGVKQRTDLYVLNQSPVPTILIEPGFITNPADERYLCSAAMQSSLAKALVLTLALFFGRR